MLHQVPQAVVWYVQAGLLKRAFDAGFDWISFLHQHGSQVAAWTLDLVHIDLVRFLIEKEVDFITTNQAYQLSEQMDGKINR